MEGSAAIADRRILLTGGAGFIASHLVERLGERNDLTLFDNLHRNALGHMGPLPDRVSLIRGDVLDAAALSRAAEGQEIVLHLAAIAGTRSVGVDAVRTMEVNLLGTRNCLEACSRAKVGRFIFFSTSEVYGVRAVDVSETDPTPIPAATEGRWAYAASKLAGEHLALACHRAGRVSSVILRPFNVYGPRQVGEGAIHDMVVASVSGAGIEVRGSGRQIRSWCYVDDFVDAVVAAVSRSEALGEIFNVGNERATVDTLTLAGTVARLAGGGTAITRVPAAGPDVETRTPSVAKARRLMGYEPRVGLEAGIRRTIEWYRSFAGAGGAAPTSS